MKIFIYLLFFSFAVNSCFGQTSQDTQSVKRIILLFQDDFNNGNFKNASIYATKNWEHINPGGGITKGRDEVLKEVRNVHQGFLKGVSMTIDSMNIRFITTDVAIVDVIHKISNYITPDGMKHENERQTKTYVIVKQKGQWLLIHDQNTIVQGSNTADNKK